MDVTTGIIIMCLCYLCGFGLIILEAFMPGFGVAGVAGIVLEIVAIVLTYTYFGTFWCVISVIAVLAVVGVAVFLSYRSAMKGRLSKSALVLKNTENTAASPDLAEWLDQEGTALTALRPAGFVEIGGARLNATASGSFLDKGTAVRVVGTEGSQLVVRKA